MISIPESIGGEQVILKVLSYAGSKTRGVLMKVYKRARAEKRHALAVFVGAYLKKP